MTVDPTPTTTSSSPDSADIAQPRVARSGGRRPLDWSHVLSVTLAGLCLVLVLIALPTLARTPNWAEDWTAYHSAALRLGSEGSLYSRLSLEGEFEPLSQNLYLYPPPLGIAVSPLTVLSAEDGAVVWYLLHVIVLALSCALMPVRQRTRILAFAVAIVSFGVFRDLIMGNVSVLLLLPLVVAWRWLDRPVGSLALAVATSVRVTFGIYMLWFVVRRAWRPLSWMVAGGAVLILLSLPVVGVEGYRDYFTMLGNVSGTTDLVQNRHLTFTMLRLGMPVELAWLVLLPVWALAIVATILSRRRDPEVGFMVTAAAALLLAPLVWDHYLSLALLPAAFLAERGRPWALAFPLFTWLPAELLPFVSIAALLLPFLARDRAAPTDDPAREPPSRDLRMTSASERPSSP